MSMALPSAGHQPTSPVGAGKQFPGAVTVSVATALVPGGARAADTLIQPGAEVNSSIGQCTLNYVFQGGGSLWASISCAWL